MSAVLITGANRGIGLEFARQYSQSGWEVIATARRSSPELKPLVFQFAVSTYRMRRLLQLSRRPSKDRSTCLSRMLEQTTR